MHHSQPRIYLDANATTPLLPEVFDAMRPWLLESFGNPSSTHQQGQHARAAIERARDQLARLLGCRASELIFTSGGTESDNLALFGTLSSGQHLITSTTEHHAILHAAQALEKRGVEVTYLPCDSAGLIAPESLRAALRPNTRLVSILFANNETGVIQPIAELARIARSQAALFHTDAVQAAGKLPLDLATDLRDVDLLSLSAHKLYGPQGVGALFLRRKTTLRPMFHGGPHERQRRAGTENVAGIVALGQAAAAAQAWLAPTPGTPGFASDTWLPNPPETLASLRDHLESSVLQQIPNSSINGRTAPRAANTTNLCFDGLEAESLLIALDLQGIAVSAGSACQSGATEPSHVLLAMGLTPAQARASIRLSLTRHTTKAEIDRTIEVVTAAVTRLRALSPQSLPGQSSPHPFSPESTRPEPQPAVPA